jgi:hypothetical protein
MTELLQKLARELAKLPEDEQDRWISHFLSELSLKEHESNTSATNKREWIGGRKPTREEVAKAIEGLREFRKGKILGDDITIKELINEGRV